jgi:expansin
LTYETIKQQVMNQIKFSFLFLFVTLKTIMAQTPLADKQILTATLLNCNQIYTGDGTFYGYSEGGNCSFPNPSTPIYTGAMNEIQYDNALTCGSCIAVTGERGTLIISIEDRCPECKFGDIDLSTQAFAMIADPIKGRVPISWKIVACPFNNGVKFRFKEGSSQYWTAVQIKNHRYPIAKLEYIVNASYVNMPRENYNYFLVAAGMGLGPFDFRITDVFGNVIEEKKIPLTLDQDINGVNQFPTSCNSLSVNDAIIVDQKINLFPNPAKEEITVQYILIENAKVAISIYDVSGKEIMNSINENQFTGEIQRTINIKNLQNGIYFLKINANESQYIQKMVVYKNN